MGRERKKKKRKEKGSMKDFEAYEELKIAKKKKQNKTKLNEMMKDEENK